MSTTLSRWLVTGGCGFIGTGLVSRLTALGGFTLLLLDNCSVGGPDDLAKVADFTLLDGPDAAPTEGGVSLVKADILDAEAVRLAAKGADVIVHLAANTGVAPSVENPRMDCEANVLGTLNCLEAARVQRVPRFVFASSGAPVGEVEPPIHEELPARPVSPYGASKLAGEAYCSAYYRTFNVGTVALRFGNVYGPGSAHKSSVVAKFIRRALAGKPSVIFGDGGQTRDFIYIDDLLEALILAAKADVGGEIFQIATNKESNISELAALLNQRLRAAAGIEMNLVHAEERLGDVRRNFSDTSKAKRILGWTPRTPMTEGLDKTIRYFLEATADKRENV